MSGSRRPKSEKTSANQKTKEIEKPFEDEGVLKNIFGRNGSEKRPPAVIDPSGEKLETIRVQQTLSAAPQKFPDVTSPSRLKAPDKTKTGVRQKEEKNRKAFLILLLLLIAIVGFGALRSLNSEDEAPLNALSPEQKAETANRVQLHRSEVGHQLNRERINVEVQNFKTAPPMGQVKKVPDPDMMAGLPLKPEGQHRNTSRERLEPISATFADANVEYGLLDQQMANEAEKLERKRYIDEFVANAAKAGLKVKVDRNGKVSVERNPSAIPMQQLLPGDSAPSHGGALN